MVGVEGLNPPTDEQKSKWQNKVKRQSPNLAGGEVQRIGFYKSLLGARYLQTTWNVNWTNQNFAGPAVWAEACIGVPPSAASATSPPFKLYTPIPITQHPIHLLRLNFKPQYQIPNTSPPFRLNPAQPNTHGTVVVRPSSLCLAGVTSSSWAEPI